MSAAYQDFLQSKRVIVPATGPVIDSQHIHHSLFPFQRDLTRWAIRKGRAAIFADTGLGKTRMQLEWARIVANPQAADWAAQAPSGNVLIVAPLSVARQTVKEAAILAIDLKYSRDGKASPMTITNYEMLDAFNPADFTAVVLDESSILKSLDGKTRKKLTEMFAQTPYRLCCTATPAPNDIAEIANHAEFLGIMTRVDMLATFFVHDDNGWRLKGHAEEPFYRWMASWGMSVRRPSDLGYSDEGYILPPLLIEPRFIETEFQPDDRLFWTGLKGIQDRSRVRKGTLTDRVLAAADLVNADEEQWIVWCGLNPESAALTEQIADAVEITGNMKPEEKAQAFEDFQDGKVRVIVTKGKIGGFGLNLQNAHKMAFVGLSDSWEMYYQCIRRCYRFGQTQPVEAFIVLSDAERSIYDNVQRKEREANDMAENLVKHVAQFEKAEISSGDEMGFQYETRDESGNAWKVMLGDSVERMGEIQEASVDLSIFSPPFSSLYVYSPSERDLGNSKDDDEFFAHFQFIVDALLRITKPGRNVCVHVSQLPTTLNHDGYIGVKDFRGDTVKLFRDRGFIYHGEICIDKDPQAQAIRTHSKALLFVQLRKDSSWLRPALADYILVFRKPGDNAVPIKPDITNNEWIEWARPIWYGIDATDTLNVTVARENSDERHICPLQLGTIERCIRLWSNKGETVCSPFAGIGSEGYEALRLGRRFVGCELKPSYFKVAVTNLKRAEAEREQETLFAEVDSELSQPIR